MSENYSVLKDIPYGEHERQVFDLFIPQNIESETGVILFVHGGGWSDGDKTIHYPEAEFLSSLGYICATMNYRFVTENINVFSELDDISFCLNAIKAKCEEYGLKTKNTILSGGSAGAHLSLLYAYARKNISPVTPVAVCVYCPPVNYWEKDFLATFIAILFS